jgi:TP901 family phage tail tape measure protein
LNSYGLATSEAADVSDILFKTVEKGVLTFSELSQNVGDAAATAALAGVSFDEIATALATMTKEGIITAEAATALNRFMQQSLNPLSKANKFIKKNAQESLSATLRTKGLAAAVKLVSEQSGGAADKLFEMGFGIRDFKAAAVLVKNDSKAFKKDLAEIAVQASRAGATNAAFAEQTKALRFELNRAKVAFSLLFIAIGEQLKPAVKAITAFVIAATEAFKALPAPAKQFLIVLAAIAAVAGPLLLLLGLLGLGASSIAAGFAALPGIIGGIASALPVILAIAAAIGGIGFAIVQLAGKGETFGEKWKDILDRIKGNTDSAFDGVVQRITTAVNTIKNVIGLIGIQFKFAFKQIGNALDFLIEELVINFSIAADRIIVSAKFIKDNWREILQAMKVGAGSFLSFLGAAFTDFFSALAKKFKDPLSAFEFSLDRAHAKALDTFQKLGGSQIEIEAPRFKDFSQLRRNLIDEIEKIDKERAKALEEFLQDVPELPAGAAEKAAIGAKEVLKDANEQAKALGAEIARGTKEGAGAFKQGSLEAFQAIQKSLITQEKLFKLQDSQNAAIEAAKAAGAGVVEGGIQEDMQTGQEGQVQVLEKVNTQLKQNNKEIQAQTSLLAEVRDNTKDSGDSIGVVSLP